MHVEKGLEMDKSIRLPLVLGELKVPASELDSDEWLELFRRALDLCQPQVKYFPGFKPLANIAQRGFPLARTRYFKIESDVQVDVRGEPRCIMLTDRSLFDGGRGSGGKEDILLLTQRAEVVRWHRVYIWDGPHESGIFVDYLWRFTSPNNYWLKQYLSAKTGPGILRMLGNAAKEGYENRLKHAESMLQLHGKLCGMSATLL